MKKIFYFSVICGLSYHLNAQVGIGTDDPKATLHIVPKSNSEYPLKIEGLKSDKNEDILSVDNQGVVKKTGLSEIKSEIKSEIGKGDVKGVLIDVKHIMGTALLTAKGTSTEPSDIPGVFINYQPDVDCNALIMISALALPSAVNYPVQGTIDLVVNDKKVSSQYYSAMDAPNGSYNLYKLGNYSTITRVVELKSNTNYTFKLQAKSWANHTLFNVDPTNGSGYVGADQSDKDAMKSSMTILFYSR